MLTIKECRKILEADENELTDEEVKQIRDFLNHLADIAIDAWEMEQKKWTQSTLAS
ncbi:MAG: hypothetical protein POELPBGB_03037 [Bacteroidia bacterium]|nr:hypothetical protein [Bacteroidia bacterium]